MSTNNNYNTFPPKLQKDEAIALLHLLHQDLLTAENRYYRAVKWAKDIQGLTFQEIGSAMGQKSKVWAFRVYNNIIKKGGEKS